MGSLFNSGTKKQTSKSKIPGWLESGSKDAVSRARGIADRDYVGYGGDRVADVNANQQSAYQLANGLYGRSQPYLSEAADAIRAGQQSFAGADLSPYMNPYQDAVTDVAAREMGEAFDQRRNAMNMNAARSGAFGGLRAELGASQLEDDYLENVGDLYARARANTYDQATGRWDRDVSRQAQAGGQLANLAQLSQGLGRDQIGALLQTGGTNYGIDQNQATADYQDFLDERGWDQSQLQPLLSTLSSVPYSRETTGTQSSRMGLGGMLAQGAGLAATAYAARSSRDYKEGGRPIEDGTLDKIGTMPVENWRYKGESTEHVGPYAEDYADRFGGSGREIPYNDAMGVQFAGLKEAAQRIKALEGKVDGRS